MYVILFKYSENCMKSGNFRMFLCFNQHLSQFDRHSLKNKTRFIMLLVFEFKHELYESDRLANIAKIIHLFLFI